MILQFTEKGSSTFANVQNFNLFINEIHVFFKIKNRFLFVKHLLILDQKLIEYFNKLIKHLCENQRYLIFWQLSNNLIHRLNVLDNRLCILVRISIHFWIPTQLLRFFKLSINRPYQNQRNFRQKLLLMLYQVFCDSIDFLIDLFMSILLSSQKYLLSNERNFSD